MSWLIAYALVGCLSFIVLDLVEGKPDDVVCWASVLWPVTLAVVIFALAYGRSRRRNEIGVKA